ncbi:MULTISPECIES: hypothetical protein [Chryseobacterium]|uniref:Lipocalin-like domain-containing protein n=1 Tax=Chryseobacterium camelliae TaxID=1265445 RepID=A0ABU0TJK7_9FLAO|nr:MULTISPECIES: hypothetical protein [Chryseobacterium]MDT3409136.1 hypothetical protein [Pseudacidovorax intermedius]MDQ1097006.1 hypothetical protein [Chryseobacterium camelliae]MDQ1100945.1 hypothetical protein [Chryseobacterium sp. SORGH_AS_1048]MDR6084387.1 hypothetical protein [Chryseobacterium sp. SORGH_AS_0909]MDR6132658.1 hypothetical protein [Chryseobacterium sp. SORGH_AS_1175]
MKKSTILILFTFGLLIISCRDKDKEASLAAREQQLLEKEKLFAQKESEYQSLIKMRDSIFAKKDSVTIASWPPEIAGSWIGKVICTESNCSDYVIGDQRTDTWEFDSDSTQLVTKIINNNNLVRIYSGKMDKNEIRLNFKTDSTSKKMVDMNVVLNDISANKIKGTRTIAADNNCMAKFSVELVRAAK